MYFLKGESLLLATALFVLSVLAAWWLLAGVAVQSSALYSAGLASPAR
jgi:uncharacterized membrane protein SpoIIM required for sporulation